MRTHTNRPVVVSTAARKSSTTSVPSASALLGVLPRVRLRCSLVRATDLVSCLLTSFRFYYWTVGICTALLIAFASLALALGQSSMVGSWRASSGFTVLVPAGAGETFELVFDRSIDHVHVVHPARWLERGRRFTWMDKQGDTHTATLEEGAKERVKDVNAAWPQSPAYWYRLR